MYCTRGSLYSIYRNVRFNLLQTKTEVSRLISTTSIHRTPTDNSAINEVNDPKQLNHKDHILQSYSNRNPRNLEMLRIARKPKGYDLDAVPPIYWYRVEYRQTGRHSHGLVRHHTGCVVVKASTEEWPLQSRLPSTTDYTAVVTVAKVLARRCLEAGITEISVEKFFTAPKSAKLTAFLHALSGGGVQLTEPFQLHETDHYDWAMERPTAPWQVPERVLGADGKKG